MSDIGEAALNFAKIVGEIDPNITSYRDFADISPLLKTFRKIFPNVSDEAEDMLQQVRSAVRFLQKNVSEDVSIMIDIEKLIEADIDEIEKMASLIFYCMQNLSKNNPEIAQSYNKIMEKLDETDREQLIPTIRPENSEHDILTKLAQSIRMFAKYYNEYNKVNAEFETVNNEFNSKKENSELIVAEEEKKIIDSHSDDIGKLKKVQTEIAELENGSSVYYPENRHTEEEFEQLNEQKDKLADEILNKKKKVEEIKQRTTNIDVLRQQSDVIDEETEPIRQEYIRIHTTLNRIQDRIENLNRKYQQKAEHLVAEVEKLKETKEKSKNQIQWNIEELTKEKTDGIVAKKIQVLIELRRIRDELKGKLYDLNQKVTFVQQSLFQGSLHLIPV